MDAPTDERLLTMPQAAKRLGRCADWVKARCDAGELVAWLIGKRRYTTAAEIAAYLDRCRLVALGRAATPRPARGRSAAAIELERMGV